MTEQSRTKVTRSEELLYEAYAPFLRRLGRAVEELEDARGEALAIMDGSREADGLTAGAVDKGADWDAATATTAETRFREGLWEQAGVLTDQAVRLHRDLAHACGARVIDRRRSVDSYPAPVASREVPDVVFGETTRAVLEPGVLAAVGEALSEAVAQGLLWTVAGGDTFTRAVTLWQTCPEVARWFARPLVDESLSVGEWYVTPPAGAGG